MLLTSLDPTHLSETVPSRTVTYQYTTERTQLPPFTFIMLLVTQC